MTPFIFISPLPQPLTEANYSDSAIGNLTLAECMKIYWLLKSATFAAQMSTHHTVRFEDEDEPYYDRTLSVNINGALTESACVCSAEPRLRGCPSGIFYSGVCEGDPFSMFYIDGPFLQAESDSENIPFAERKFMFVPYIEIECGSLVASTRDIYDGGDYEKVGQVPCEIADTQFNINLYLPTNLAHPDIYTTFEYQYSISLQFETH